MKKTVIMKLGVAVFIVALATGCQSSRLYNKKLINTAMTNWKTALMAQDLDKVVATYSENYTSTRGSGKDSVRERITRIFDQGYLDNVKVNLEDAETTIDGDKAKFGPVEFISDRGAFTREYRLQKENGAWLIIGSKRQQE
jgi:hypothetical protein